MLPNAAPSRQLSEWVRGSLMYLGILTTFTAVSLIACMVWLLIW
jgi:hypothetical protein